MAGKKKRALSLLALAIRIFSLSAIMLLEGVERSPSLGGQSEANTAAPVTQLPLAASPLRVSPSNPRYFTDGSGKVVYLTGSHTHRNFQDGPDGIPDFDYLTYLDILQHHNHNFIRLWTWEDFQHDPLPYLRTGPGLALDGQPKFDVTQLNQAYFDRLRSRVVTAAQRGIYVSIMLFQGWSIEAKISHTCCRDIWKKHPFHKDNNINEIDGDLDHDGQGAETHTLQNSVITFVQKAYIRQVIDTLNDLDNVLFEIANEPNGYPDTTEWQYDLVTYIKSYESTKPKQHPVGMNIDGINGKNALLFAGPADWVSPIPTDAEPYRDNPPLADDTKVILSDTDHLFGAEVPRAWVWKSFVRGLQPILMDLAPPLDTWDFPKEADAIRESLGHTRLYATKMNLMAMVPRSDLCSSTYCLADPGKEYLVYLPLPPRDTQTESLPKNTVIVDLSATSDTLIVEWFDPNTARTILAETVNGGERREFTSPFAGDAVLYISAGKAS